MSGFDGSGTFSDVHNWTTDRNDGLTIQAARMDEQDDAQATGLSNTICKDGQSTPTANIGFGGFKVTNVGDATNATDALNRQTGDARYHPIGVVVTVDNTLPRFNGIAGALQESGIVVDDSNNVTGMATNTLPNTGLKLLDTNASHSLVIKPGSDLTAERTLTVTTGDANRLVSVAGDLTTAAAFTTSGAFALTLTQTGATNVTLPTTGTLATLAGSESLSNKTLASPVITTNAGAATISLPTATDTLLGRATTDTVTNKTLDNTNTVTLKDTLFTLQDDGDVTKQARFELSGITTGTIRTYTLPNATATLVGLNTSQTLTGKTINGPDNTLTSIASTSLTDYVAPTSFTPTLAFATPGTSSWSYATQTGFYTRNGNVVLVEISITATPTIGSAAGNLIIGTLPVAASANSIMQGTALVSSANWTWPASRAQVHASGNTTTTLILRATGTGAAVNTFTTANMTNSASHTLLISLMYFV